ncbi:MAG: chemotaxis protein CheD [Thermoplasmata archaeon]|nr:chemotaxis protein CheD [Thermoplasmata archaeon]MCJ7561894.1 chemotaxis protein CheD [Thermoplasmata archaeon]TFG70862.1 MAG: chemotaxis protein CheD [Methanomassiliicoccus sp.]
MKEPILVGISQIVVARAPEQICCMGLGSCVAVFLYDHQMRLGGVVHILLPRAPLKVENEGKYADTGVKKLFSDMIAKGARKERIRAKLVGGAQMFPNLNVHISDIGGDNCREVKKGLKELGIKIIAEDLHGDMGRSATFDLVEGQVIIKTAFADARTI